MKSQIPFHLTVITTLCLTLSGCATQKPVASTESFKPLETGAFPYFEPARKLYATFGFVNCEPFANYKPDPNSVFMTKEL